jgi:hypothetical protein
MIPPPADLNGDPVVRYAIFPPFISPTGMTRHLVDGKFPSGVAALAICRRATEDGFTLCFCNEDWGVLAHSVHPSLDDAAQHAEFENDGVVPNWRSTGR